MLRSHGNAQNEKLQMLTLPNFYSKYIYILPVLTNTAPVGCDFCQHAWIWCRAKRDSIPNFPS